MKNAIRQFIKTFNSYSKSDRHAILILGGLILFFAVAKFIAGFIPDKAETNNTKIEQLLKELRESKKQEQSAKKLFQFDPNTTEVAQLDSLDIPAFVKNNLINYRKAGGVFKSNNDVQKIYGMTDSLFARLEPYIQISRVNEENKPYKNNHHSIATNGNFNPNLATEEELIRFGFSRYQAKNLVEYRKKGGVFKVAHDLLKIYGIDSAFYKSIEKQIIIESTLQAVTLEKEKEIEVVELNSSDSLKLVKINGVGGVFAKRILKYRQMLGGYYSKNQLMEVYGITPEIYKSIEPNVIVDTLMIKKIRINFADFNEFIKHPYINKKQIDAILKYREKNGSFTEINQLKSAGLLDESTFNRIAPYLTAR